METVDVAIIGSGFGGLAVAVSLRQAGIGPIVILEAADRVGGTWRENTYPGAACDVTSALYSFSFHPYVWSRKYPLQPEILAYIEEVVDVCGLCPLLRFGAEVTDVTYDDERGRWTVTTASGDVVDARVVVSSVGQLNQPALPDLPGLSSFGGPSFHSARWDHSVDLEAKHVGVIGTGASAIQFVPQIAPLAASTTIFQRSAPYVLPKPDPVNPSWRRRLYATIPQAQLPARAKTFVLNEIFGSSILGNEGIRRRVTARWRASMHGQITDPELRQVCEPDYELGCKRALIADDWYPTLARDDVSVVTSAIAEVTTDGVRMIDGDEISLDVLIYATGFHATDFLTPMRVTGAGGLTLEARWRDGAAAFKGVCVSGFPNFFMTYGPNTNLGANSIVYMIESQAHYIQQVLLAARRARAQSVEVRTRAEAEWADMIEDKSSATAWITGCHSWYTTNGRNTNNWPDATWRYRRALREADLLDFEVRPIKPVAAAS